MSGQTVLEELTRDELTSEYVQRRVEDWAERIEALYKQVESWLPDRWAAKRGGPVTMSEDLMSKSGVQSRQLPTLELVRDGSDQVVFRPYGLWIIGTNGRIDLVARQERYFLHDRAGTFDAANWYVALATARQDSEPFNDAWLKAFLAT